MIVVNASNTAPRVGAHRRPEGRRQRPAQGHLRRGRPARGAGPADAEALLQPLADHPARRHRLLPLRRRARSPGAQCFISRTGYTGEDGFELYCRERDTVAALGGAHRGRRQADRPRRPRFAPAGDGLRALRQRDRRHHHAARGRARLDREARQGRAVHRATTRSAPRSSAASPGSWSASGSRAAAFPATAIRCITRAREVDIVRSGTHEPVARRRPIGTTYLPAAAAKAGHEVRGRVPRRADPGGGGEAAVLDQGEREEVAGTAVGYVTLNEVKGTICAWPPSLRSG